MNKPNLIFIAADQLRYDVLGRGYTPNIDAIVAESVSFTRAYCACPLCVPARGALFTGTYPNTNKSLINPWLAQDKSFGYVQNGIDNLYDLMEREGYDCLHSGKQHLYLQRGILEDKPDTKTRWLSTEHTYKEFLSLNGARAPGGAAFRSPVPEMGQGHFTRVCTYSNANTGKYEHGVDCYFDGYFTNKAMEGLRTRDKDKPLFLSAMFLAPHPPLEIPDPYFSALSLDEIKLPDNVGKWYPYQSPMQMYNLTGVIGARYQQDQWVEAWRTYLGLVMLLDDCVKRLITELKEQNIYDNSIIIFTSDHGEMLGSHRLFQKMCMYEESVRIPLSIRLPFGHLAGKSIGEPVSHIDVLPTICELINARLNSQPDGKSLVGAIENNHEVNKDVFIQFDGNGSLSNFQRCVISGTKKLIVDIFKDELYFELYDVETDRLETDNLIFRDNGIQQAQELLCKLIAHMRSTEDHIALPEIDLSEFVKNYCDLPSRA